MKGLFSNPSMTQIRQLPGVVARLSYPELGELDSQQHQTFSSGCQVIMLMADRTLYGF